MVGLLWSVDTNIALHLRAVKQNTRGHFLVQRCKRTAIEIFQTQ